MKALTNPDTIYLYNDNLCIPDSAVVVGATVLVPPVTKDLYWRTFYKYLFICFYGVLLYVILNYIQKFTRFTFKS